MPSGHSAIEPDSELAIRSHRVTYASDRSLMKRDAFLGPPRAQIVTTTLVPHATTAFDVMPLLVPAIREFAANR